MAALQELSGRAARAGLANLIYVRSAVEGLPPELHGVADTVTVILPWGSLLAAVARPSVAALQGIRELCRAGALLTVVVSIDAARDFAEAGRLGLPLLDSAHLAGPLTAGYAAAGFAVCSAQPLDADQLARWPSTWARRLAHGRARPVLQIDARAVRLHAVRDADEPDLGAEGAQNGSKPLNCALRRAVVRRARRALTLFRGQRQGSTASAYRARKAGVYASPQSTSSIMPMSASKNSRDS